MNSVRLKAHEVRYVETSDRLIKQNTSSVYFSFITPTVHWAATPCLLKKFKLLREAA
jgi:hypothetical protein